MQGFEIGSMEELMKSLSITLREAIELNREDAIREAATNFNEEPVYAWNAEIFSDILPQENAVFFVKAEAIHSDFHLPGNRASGCFQIGNLPDWHLSNPQSMFYTDWHSFHSMGIWDWSEESGKTSSIFKKWKNC